MRKREIIKVDYINPNEIILHNSQIMPDMQKIKTLAILRASKYRDDPWNFLSVKLGVDRNYLVQLKKYKNVSLLYLRYIADALDVNVNEIVDLGGYYYLLEK